MRLWIDDEVESQGKWVSVLVCRCGRKVPVDLSAYRERMVFTGIELPRCECGHVLLSVAHSSA